MAPFFSNLLCPGLLQGQGAVPASGSKRRTVRSPWTPHPVSSSEVRHDGKAPGVCSDNRAAGHMDLVTDLRFLVHGRQVPTVPRHSRSPRSQGTAWRLEPDSVAHYPPINHQEILLSLLLPICLEELLSVCFQRELISVLRA